MTDKLQNEKQSLTGRHEAVAPVQKTAVPAKRRLSKRGMYLICCGAAALLLFITALVLKGVSRGNDYKDYYDHAVACYEAGQYTEALSDLRKAMELDPNDDCRMRMVDCYQAQGNYEKCLELLRGMDIHDPAIEARILQIDRVIESLAHADYITVADGTYAPDTASLILSSKGLDSFVFQQLRELYSLTSLDLSNNRIADLSGVESLGGLTTLDLSGNQISGLSPLSSLSVLRSLSLDSNPITDFSPLYALTGLTSLSIRGIEITESQLRALSEHLPNCAIRSETAVAEVADISLGGFTFKADVTELDLSYMGLSDISALSACKELRELDLTGNNIRDLTPLMDIPGLEWLCICCNQVSDLRPLMSMKSLHYLNAESNSIASTQPISPLTGLVTLKLSDNPLTDLSGVSSLRNLETLELRNTGLTDAQLESLYALSSLQNLDIRENEEISGEGFDALDAAIRSCNIEHSELVYSVEFAGERFKENITELDVSNRGITDIAPMLGFKNLEKVNLSFNSITNIYSFEWMPTIRELNLSCNGLQDITALSHLTALEVLDLSNNQVNNLNAIMALDKLRVLYLAGNQLTEEQIRNFCDAHPDCTVYY